MLGELWMKGLGSKAGKGFEDASGSAASVSNFKAHHGEPYPPMQMPMLEKDNTEPVS